MLLIRLNWVLILLFVLANGLAYADKTTDTINEPSIISESFLLDPTSIYTYTDVKNKVFDDSKESAVNLLSKLNRNRSVWVKQVLENPTNEIFRGFIYSWSCSERIYYWEKNDSLYSDTLGLLYPKVDDALYYNRFLLPIELQPGEKQILYFKNREFIRYIFSYPLKSDITNIETFREIAGTAGSSSLVNLNVFFNGLLVFQLLYIILQWFLVRRVEYIYYALYIISVFAYFWPRHIVSTMNIEGLDTFFAYFVMYFNDILLLLPTYFYLRFCRYFIDMPHHRPKWNKIVKYFEYCFLFLTVIILFTNVLIPNDLPKNTFVLASVGIQFFLSIVVLRMFYDVKLILTRFILTAGIIAITAHLLALSISVFGLYIYFNISPIAITMTAIIIEIAIFNSGLLFKARQMEDDKFKAQTILLEELEAKQKLQLEYAGVRDKISRDLHDDIGSTLSSVSIYSYAAKDKLSKGDISQTKDLLALIEKNALSTLNSMGDLVWAINPLNDSITKLFERINTFGYSILTVKDCKFEMNIDPDFYNFKLNLEQRRSLLLICKEALNNVAKYAEASEVRLKIYRHGEKFRVEISDNGKGFNISEDQNGNGLRSMKTRAAKLSNFFEIKSTNHGTNILFEIDKNLVIN